MTRFKLSGIVSNLMVWTASINVYQITINQVAIIEYHGLKPPEWGANAATRGELVIWIIGLGMVAAIVARFRTCGVSGAQEQNDAYESDAAAQAANQILINQSGLGKRCRSAATFSGD
jgi:hypothetical protein